jgi:glycosyltransferase involved in cell wall biosynthesis
VDVILPFHRDDEFLRVAVDSILASQNVIVRLLLIDDRKIPIAISDLDCYIKVHTEGAGYAEAINSALPHLQSEYVALMNSDDWSSPDRLHKQILSLEKFDAELSICSLKKFEKNHVLPALLGEIETEILDSNILLLGAYGANATWLATSKVWKESVRFEKSNVSDWLTAMKMFNRFRTAYLNENLYWYRKHPNQITSSDFQKRNAHRDLLDEASKLAKNLHI